MFRHTHTLTLRLNLYSFQFLSKLRQYFPFDYFYMVLWHAFHTNIPFISGICGEFYYTLLKYHPLLHERACVPGKLMWCERGVTYLNYCVTSMSSDNFNSPCLTFRCADTGRERERECLNGFICIKLPQIKWTTFQPYIQEMMTTRGYKIWIVVKYKTTKYCNGYTVSKCREN